MSALSDTILAFYSGELGLITTDDTGNGNTLTNNNGVTSELGKVGNAWSFDQDLAQSLSIDDNATFSLGSTDMYMAMLVRLKTKNNLGKTFFAKDNGGSTREYFGLYFEGSDRFIFDTWTGASGTGNARVTFDSFGSPSISTWYWLEFTVDSGAGEMWGCVNNDPAYKDTVSAPGAGWDGDDPLRIGTLFDFPGWYMDGLIDQFLFSKTIPSDDDRTWLYNDGAMRSWADIVNKDSPSLVVRRYYDLLVGAASHV